MSTLTCSAVCTSVAVWMLRLEHRPSQVRAQNLQTSSQSLSLPACQPSGRILLISMLLTRCALACMAGNNSAGLDAMHACATWTDWGGSRRLGEVALWP